MLLWSLIAFPGFAQEMKNESAQAAKDINVEWFFPEWLGKAPSAPVFEVRDTENKYGRYAKQTKTITIKDLIKFHGHFCGGLVESAASLRVAFDLLFPDRIIDRTDLRIVSNNSACGGDVAAYLTGARARFNTHIIDNSLTESEFYVQQVSTGKTVHVRSSRQNLPGKQTIEDANSLRRARCHHAVRDPARVIVRANLARRSPRRSPSAKGASWSAPTTARCGASTCARAGSRRPGSEDRLHRGRRGVSPISPVVHFRVPAIGPGQPGGRLPLLHRGLAQGGRGHRPLRSPLAAPRRQLGKRRYRQVLLRFSP